jgi:hypothetical protein
MDTDIIRFHAHEYILETHATNTLITPQTQINLTPQTNSTHSFLKHSELLSLCDILNDTDSEEVGTNRFINESHYYNIEQINELLNEKQYITIATLNCQSLNAKHLQLETILNALSNSFDILCLQETWLVDDADVSLLQLPNYQFLWKGASASSHGGVALYIKNNIQYSIMPTSIDSSLWEGIFVEIKTTSLHKDIIIGSVYRPPHNMSEDRMNFIEEFSQTLQSFHHNNTDLYIAGDYNFDLLKISHNTSTLHYFTSITSSGLDPLITLPTRITDNSHTLIDNIFTNSPQSTSLSGILTTQISDHQLCFTSLPIKTNKQTHNKYITITHRPHNIDELMLLDLQNIDIYSRLNTDPHTDPTENCHTLQSTISSLIHKHTSTKTLKFNKHKHKKTAWITQGIIRSIRFRDKLHLKMKRSPPDSEQRQSLKININTYNKILKNTIRTAKAIHYNQIFTHSQNNSKETWKEINNILNRNRQKNTQIEYITHNNTKIDTPQQIANELNTYFTQIGHQIASNIPTTAYNIHEYLTPNTASPFEFTNVQPTDIDLIIRQLKSKFSTGHDDISSSLIKSLRTELINPLTLIANQMINTSIFPDSLKIAKIKPLHKKGPIDKCANYRPISLLPSISKILEKIILKQIDSHFTVNNLYFNSQYGFRKKHSTEHAIIELTDRLITSLDRNNTPTSIFIDLTKAFDCIDHDILLTKLKHYNIQNKAHDLCRHYLSNRQQYITLNDTQSDLLNITTGVPQGSILGPLFFLIYINDISNSTPSLKFITYADDTTLLANIHSTNPCNINQELQNVSTWFSTNKLSLNASKTKAITFHTPHRNITPPILNINNQPIENTNETNFLGITIDKHLNFKPHINKIATKLSRISGILNKLKHFVPHFTLKTIYQSLFIPHLTYGIMAWSKSPHSSQIVKIQKKAVRIITNSKYNAHTDPLFHKLKILKMEDLRRLFELKFFYKWKNGDLPYYFHDFLDPGRDENRLLVPIHRHQFFKSGLRYTITKTVNSTPDNILRISSTHSLKALSERVKTHYINNYSTDCILSNCYVCSNQ